MRAGRARRLVVPDAILGEAVLVRRFASDALKEFRTPLPRVAIVVGLGGRTGSALVAPLAEQLLRTDQVLIACTIPFRFEGRNRRRRTDEALVKVVGLGCRLTVVECEAHLKRVPRDMPFSDALAWIDQSVAAVTREWFVGT